MKPVEAGGLVLVMSFWLVLSVCHLDLIAAFFRETRATVGTSSGGRSLKLYVRDYELDRECRRWLEWTRKTGSWLKGKSCQIQEMAEMKSLLVKVDSHCHGII